MYYQQGDIIIEAVNKIKGKKLKHNILAEGETTGHQHTITKDRAELYEDDGTLYLRVDNKAEVTHQEHNTITIPRGDYIIRRVREYDHFREEARNVQD